jgi:bifunctional non-homologous end joining protein LigD
LKTNQSPFLQVPKTNEPVQWVKPNLVAQIKFSEWTADRRMRHPIFLGMRTDKKAAECTFETKRATSKVVRSKKGSK